MRSGEPGSSRSRARVELAMILPSKLTVTRPTAGVIFLEPDLHREEVAQR